MQPTQACAAGQQSALRLSHTRTRPSGMDGRRFAASPPMMNAQHQQVGCESPMEEDRNRSAGPNARADRDSSGSHSEGSSPSDRSIRNPAATAREPVRPITPARFTREIEIDLDHQSNDQELADEQLAIGEQAGKPLLRRRQEAHVPQLDDDLPKHVKQNKSDSDHKAQAVRDTS